MQQPDERISLRKESPHEDIEDHARNKKQYIISEPMLWNKLL